MKQTITDIEYSETNATKGQVKHAVCIAQVIMARPLPLSHVLPFAALVGYKEDKTGRYMLLKEIRVFQTREHFVSMTPLAGHVRLFALQRLHTTEERDAALAAYGNSIPPYRVYESFTASGESFINNSDQ